MYKQRKKRERNVQAIHRRNMKEKGILRKEMLKFMSNKEREFTTMMGCYFTSPQHGEYFSV